MTKDRLPLAVASLALALSLSGCATTGTGTPGVADASAAERDVPVAAITRTRVVSTGSVRSPAEGAVPRRAPARVMRIWIAPWEDSRGDLHAPGYLYTEIEPRRWTLDARDEHMPRIRPLQIERRDAQPNTSRSGPSSRGKRRSDSGRTRGKAAVPETGPNLLGS